jgi:tripartite-type tricarboxylate transporter receptor subunit TctC
MAPAKTPPAVIRTLNAAIAKALQDPDIRPRLAQYDVEPRGSSAEEYGAFLRSELERWTRVIRNADLKLE